MKSVWIALILIVIIAASGSSLSLAQTSEQELPKSKERMNGSTWKQPPLVRSGTTLSRGLAPSYAFFKIEDANTDQLMHSETLFLTRRTQSISHSVLQFLNTAGKTLLNGGVLSIIMIYIVLLLIIQLRISHSNKGEWKLIM